MKTRKGSNARIIAASVSILSFKSGSIPPDQASVNTGSITKYVRNKARLTISKFGGDCCSPMPCLRIERTVTMKGKQVIMIASPGARLKTVISRINWIVRADRDASSPNEMEISCAIAGPAAKAADAAAALSNHAETRGFIPGRLADQPPRSGARPAGPADRPPALRVHRAQ